MYLTGSFYSCVLVGFDEWHVNLLCREICLKQKHNWISFECNGLSSGRFICTCRKNVVPLSAE